MVKDVASKETQLPYLDLHGLQRFLPSSHRILEIGDSLTALNWAERKRSWLHPSA